ncbi:hypothetical protein D3C73_1336050 [compost metagenome]
MVGLGVKLAGATEHIAIKQLEDNQLDLDVHAQVASGPKEALAEHRRPQGIVLLDQRPAQQRAEAGGELVKGKSVAIEHLIDHRIHSLVTLQPVIRQRPTGIGRQ